ncbi:hypothetical protein GIB67_016507 [Kingdonia uniflora]|uniref:RING-type E3 ubiquitin transferase n=1 Tax=Kingdonia uniflora TaxID=39325 RepID=A0A7J7M822_9MAGN|nr:hypothetical protein GIB67_016507 [Kingdonia uniflora]
MGFKFKHRTSFSTCDPCIPSVPCRSDNCIPLTSPPPPSKPYHLSPLVIILIVALSIAFLIIIYYAILSKYSNWNHSRILQNQSNNTQEQFIDEHHQHGHIDHPIWLINRVGLDATIINSIAVFKYSKGDGLVDGTECSVCLNEFDENETLRLLPKCSHAFHLPCIDTWLGSHTNCPLCRAPVVKPAVAVSVEASSNEGEVSLSTGVESSVTSVENLEDEEEVDHSEDDDSFVVVELDDERELRGAAKTPEVSGGHELVGNGIQPIRRSISMDSLSLASVFCFSVANSLPVEDQEESSTSKLKGKKISNSGRLITKHTARTQSMSGSIGTFSSLTEKSIPEEPVAMKRSFSSGGKLFLSRYSRSGNSILPL